MKGRVLDLACGSGHRAMALAAQGWQVTGVDIAIKPMPGVTCNEADLAAHEYRVQPDSWDLIICWLYWQPDLLPEIARGVRKGGIVGLAGKTSGRFATSLSNYRAAFPGWTELAAGEDGFKAFLIARR